MLGRSIGLTVTVHAVAIALGASPPAIGANPGAIGPGSYCRLPEPGEKPACLEPAKQTYGADVFAALDAGNVTDAQLEQLEDDVAAGSNSDNAYLALSSLTYAYWRMAQQAATAPGEDPAIVARLDRWNRLLGGAFETSSDPEFRDAMVVAAEDLRDRAPAVSLRCVDSKGATSQCDSTDALLRGYEAASAEIGIRGALRRLFERITGRDS